MAQNEKHNEKHHGALQLNNEEIQLMGDNQSFVKPERWPEMGISIPKL